MMGRKYIFSSDDFERLKSEKAKDPRMTLAQFARKIGVGPGTLSTGIKESEYRDDVFGLFPMMKTKSVEARRRETEKRSIPAGDIGTLPLNMSNPHVRAAVMRWAA